MCPGATSSMDEMKAFIDVAARHIAARLNSAAPGANLDPQDAYAIMHLCPFETVAKEKLSPFCPLFSGKDFQIYEYVGTSRNSTAFGMHQKPSSHPLR